LPQRGEARSSAPPLLAFVVHVVVLVVVVRAIIVPVLDFLTRTGERPVVERITYVEPEPEPERPVTPPPSTTRATPGLPTAVASRPLPVRPTPPSATDTGRALRAGPPIELGPGRQVFGSGVAGLTTGPVDPRLVAPPGIPNAPVRAPSRNANTVVNSWVGA